MRIKLLMAPAIAIIAFVIFSTQVYACKCSKSNEKRNTEAADIVVLARALKGREHVEPESLLTLIAQKFVVEKIYKDIPKEKERGAMLIRRPMVGKEITVLQESSNCIFIFEPGGVYKIFGRLEEGNSADYTRLVTNKCSGTRRYKVSSVNLCDSNTIFAAKNTLLDFSNRDNAEVKNALERVFNCYTSVVGAEERLIDKKTGERFTSIDHRVSELDLILYFSRGELVGVSEISSGLYK